MTRVTLDTKGNDEPMNSTTSSRRYTLDSIKGSEGVTAITLGEEAIERLLVDTCNEENSKVIGISKTRKNVLKNDFRSEDMMIAIECIKSVNENPTMMESLASVIKTYLERAFRCFVPQGMVGEVSSIVARYLTAYTPEELVEKTKSYVGEKADTIEGFVFIKEVQKRGVAK